MINAETKTIRKRVDRRERVKNDREKRRIFLRGLGFKEEDAIKYLSEKASIEKIQQRIERLSMISDKEWAIKLLERRPHISGIDIERGLGKIKSANEFLRQYKLPELPEKDLLEKFPPFINRNTERINFSLMAVGELSRNLPKEELSSSKIIEGIVKFLIPNPYLVFSCLEQKKPQNIKEIYISGYLNKLGKKERKRIIEETKGNMPKTPERLEKSKDHYDNEFLFKLAKQSEVLEKVEKKQTYDENLR